MQRHILNAAFNRGSRKGAYFVGNAAAIVDEMLEKKAVYSHKLYKEKGHIFERRNVIDAYQVMQSCNKNLKRIQRHLKSAEEELSGDELKTRKDELLAQQQEVLNDRKEALADEELQSMNERLQHLEEELSSLRQELGTDPFMRLDGELMEKMVELFRKAGKALAKYDATKVELPSTKCIAIL